MARKKVYVSSTLKDLEEHRSAVKATLERAGFDVECMEKYPAFDERPRDKCLADVAECDYYVLILAWRYGFQPEDDNPKKLSITHLEYEEAVRLKKPCLPFLLDPDAPWKRGFQDPDSHSPDSAICRFRDHVEKCHGRSFYTTRDGRVVLLIDEADDFVHADRDKGYATLQTFRAVSEEGRAQFILAGFWSLYKQAALD